MSEIKDQGTCGKLLLLSLDNKLIMLSLWFKDHAGHSQVVSLTS